MRQKTFLPQLNKQTKSLRFIDGSLYLFLGFAALSCPQPLVFFFFIKSKQKPTNTQTKNKRIGQAASHCSLFNVIFDSFLPSCYYYYYEHDETDKKDEKIIKNKHDYQATFRYAINVSIVFGFFISYHLIG